MNILNKLFFGTFSNRFLVSMAACLALTVGMDANSDEVSDCMAALLQDAGDDTTVGQLRAQCQQTSETTAVVEVAVQQEQFEESEYKQNKRYIDIRIKVPNIPSHQILNRNSG